MEKKPAICTPLGKCQSILLVGLFCYAAGSWASFQVKSTPAEAEIFIQNTSGAQKVRIGVTPYDTQIEQILASYAPGGNFIIEVSKKGHEPYRVLVSLMGKTKLELNVNLPIARDVELAKKFDFIVNRLFEAQRLARLKNYEDAMKILSEMEESFPEISAIFEMKGSVYYLMKDFQKSLSYYRRAFSLNPDNYDTYAIKAYLEESLGLDKKQN